MSSLWNDTSSETLVHQNPETLRFLFFFIHFLYLVGIIAIMKCNYNSTSRQSVPSSMQM